jgi:hypothetical protein
VRVGSDPATVLAGPNGNRLQDAIDRMAAINRGFGISSPPVSTLSFGALGGGFGTFSLLSDPVNTQVQGYLLSGMDSNAQGITLDMDDDEEGEGLVSDASYGLAGRMDPGWVLGSPGSQPLANGIASAPPAFDFWVETMEL